MPVATPTEIVQLSPLPVTVPLPVPAPEIVIVGPGGLKAAVTDRFVVSATVVQFVAVPEQASAQPLNRLVPVGAAVSVTVLPLATTTKQVPVGVPPVMAQFIPPPVTVPLPEPLPTTESLTAWLTMKVTLIVWGLLSAPLAVMGRVAVYVPGESEPSAGVRTSTDGADEPDNVAVSHPLGWPAPYWMA